MNKKERITHEHVNILINKAIIVLVLLVVDSINYKTKTTAIWIYINKDFLFLEE